MMRHYVFGILMLIACSLLEVSTFPSNHESTTSVENVAPDVKNVAPAVENIAPDEKDERSLTYDETNIENEDATKEIVKRIAAINEALKKPNIHRHPAPWNPPADTNEGYALDKEILEKLQQVIASGKLHSYASNVNQQESNAINEEPNEIIRYSRQISPLFAANQMPTAFMTSIPVLIMPSTNNNMYSQLNSMDFASQYQTKQSPSPSPSPFQPFQWPFAQLFPILIRDPFLSIMNGGGFQNFIEVGQSADVCKRKQKSEENVNDLTENEDLEKAANLLLSSSDKLNPRVKRAIKKRTVSLRNQLHKTNKGKKLFSIKPAVTKPVKQEPIKITKTVNENEGDLRFPFLFGQKDKPPAGPGFFINRLKVRRGGVAIAGPGGVATAGRGGTAIVGPGGLAYTQPGGLAVAGPAARVVALSSEADLTSVANRLQKQSAINGSVPELLQAIPEGRVVATGPIVYFHPDT